MLTGYRSLHPDTKLGMPGRFQVQDTHEKQALPGRYSKPSISGPERGRPPAKPVQDEIERALQLLPRTERDHEAGGQVQDDNDSPGGTGKVKIRLYGTYLCGWRAFLFSLSRLLVKVNSKVLFFWTIVHYKRLLCLTSVRHKRILLQDVTRMMVNLNFKTFPFAGLAYPCQFRVS